MVRCGELSCRTQPCCLGHALSPSVGGDTHYTTIQYNTSYGRNRVAVTLATNRTAWALHHTVLYRLSLLHVVISTSSNTPYPLHCMHCRSKLGVNPTAPTNGACTRTRQVQQGTQTQQDDTVCHVTKSINTSYAVCLY